jgi:hypothetical protein
MEKTEWKKELMVETISVLPRTLEIKEELMKIGSGDKATNAQMYVVIGHDPATRRVWCATFIDQQEAECFVMSSKTFGRPILGAVMAGQEENKLATDKAEKGAEMSDDVIGVDGDDSVN